MESINLNTKILDNYKMKLFNELIRLVWEDNLEEIDNIPQKIIGEDVYEKFDKETITNLMRVTMGLDVSEEYDLTLKELAYEAMNMDEVTQPIISIISQACKYCDRTNKEEECFVKEKHINCNVNNTCSSCGDCVSKCNIGAISDKIQFMPMINLLKDEECPVYAIVAPAFVGQFGEEVTPGKLRSALKFLGFEDMVEVALAADLLTAKEAYEYCEHMKENPEGYFITSCCCPVWVGMIENNFKHVLPNVSPSVSPMIACGRSIKLLNPDAKVVFIGPCMAKKKEAVIDELKGAIDFVLTFKEVEEIFNALNVNLVDQEDEIRVESSFAGRVYAKSGGVSEAIKTSAKRINEDIKFISHSFQGVKECKEGLEKLSNNEINATFIEGMGCVGGCVGGPKRILSVEKGTKYVEDYCEETQMNTPFENLNVIQFLTMMGIKRIESLGEKEEEQVLKIFSRNITDNN